MFKACMPVIRCDIQSARFLMPYLLQCVISTGSPDSCKGDTICSASRTETTTHLLCIAAPHTSMILAIRLRLDVFTCLPCSALCTSKHICLTGHIHTSTAQCKLAMVACKGTASLIMVIFTMLASLGQVHVMTAVAFQAELSGPGACNDSHRPSRQMCTARHPATW